MMQVMSADAENKIHKILEEFINPITNRPIAHEASKIVLQNGTVTFSLTIDKKHLEVMEKVKKELIRKIAELEDISNVQIVFTSSSKYDASASKVDRKSPVRGVKKIILVASGKGGVGKSTVAANLAISLSKLGKKVGIVDVDIYGPSLPLILGISKKPVLINDMMEPIVKYGLKTMSIGFLVNESDALIWRGPMTTKMLYQLIRQTDWAYDNQDVDYLIIDSPPGTGDVHLSLAENYKIDGAILVTLPQAMATNDVRKSMTMCNKLHIPILGVVENMSSHHKTGELIFGKSTVSKLIKEFNVSLLEKIPLSEDLAIASDLGQPLTISDDNSDITKIYKSLAEKVLKI